MVPTSSVFLSLTTLVARRLWLVAEYECNSASEYLR